jgi:hypothetical protein
MRSEIISSLLEGTLFEEQIYYVSASSSQTGSLQVASILKPADSQCVSLPRVTVSLEICCRSLSRVKTMVPYVSICLPTRLCKPPRYFLTSAVRGSKPWDFVMDKSGAGAGFLRELRFPLPIYIPSALHNHLRYHPRLAQ